jgi:opacity protein-like surface antigen
MKKFLTAAVLVAIVAPVTQAAVISLPGLDGYTSPLWNGTTWSNAGSFDLGGKTIGVSFTSDVGISRSDDNNGTGIYGARLQLDSDATYYLTFTGLDPATAYDIVLTTDQGGSQTREYTFDVTTGTPAVKKTLTLDATPRATTDFQDGYTLNYTVTPDADGDIVFEGTGANNYRYHTLKGVQIVPEPATMALLGLGSLAALKRRRRA